MLGATGLPTCASFALAPSAVLGRATAALIVSLQSSRKTSSCAQRQVCARFVQTSRLTGGEHQRQGHSLVGQASSKHFATTGSLFPKVCAPLTSGGSAWKHSMGYNVGERTAVVGSVATEAPAATAPEMEVEDAMAEKFLKDYKPPTYHFDTVNLTFKLEEENTRVLSRIQIQPAVDEPGPLVLDGVGLKLVNLKVDGRDVAPEEYKLTSRKLHLLSPPAGAFTLEVETENQPQTNTSLEGLYKSSGNFCTQCEAEAFRKITYFQDRPDVMAKFTTRIEANKELYPVLLSNGNLVESGDLEDGRHFAVWEDPHKKPSYLFALVAGNLVVRENSFRTMSGKDVALRIFVQEHNLGKTEYAMESLKAAMKWDEEVYGLEYDLELFNIVAVDDFNMGAMENKSLNIFNSRLVLASPDTATDADYSAIEAVVGHEYFHNWTGNKVTCRDWFQLSLKEGLTVFRDQEFSSDLNSRAVKRISDVVILRNSQFSQDAGPMAHAVRPESYIKMDNFYTVTVYEKGAEVVRMYQTLLGKEGFRKGMDLYFKRHDGQAVTCDDFLAAMRDANNADLSIFARWYEQAGTPLLTVSGSYDAAGKTFTVSVAQELPATPGQPHKQPVLIPLAMGLVGRDGRDLALTEVAEDGATRALPEGTTTAVLRVEKAKQEFVFMNIAEEPVPSYLRGFSAPVRLQSNVTEEELLFLLAYDSDEFCRWEAGQQLARKIMLALVQKQQKGEPLVADAAFVGAIRSLVTDKNLDKAFLARALVLPSESEIADLMDEADPDAIHAVAKFLSRTLATELRQELLDIYEANRAPPGDVYKADHSSKARRSLKNTALAYLSKLEGDAATQALVQAEFAGASNMTDQLAALAALCGRVGDARAAALDKFYQQWKEDSLVMNKWLALQAMSDIENNVENVRALLSHPAFDITNPNKVYSLVGRFCACPVTFHAADGSGYKFLGDMVLELDAINPQVASRMVSNFTRWRKYDKERRALALGQLQRIVAQNGLSANVYEIASKSLADAP